ncbi:hypothetical protein N9H39_04710 [Gammaproteobacteria bacterium]|nr:hypothetical protein [Gammaproteobacteria bacterium]
MEKAASGTDIRVELECPQRNGTVRLALLIGVVMRQNGDFNPINKETRRTMNKHSENRDIKVVAIDLAKKSFQLHGVDTSGHKIVLKKLTRNKLKIFKVCEPAIYVSF